MHHKTEKKQLKLVMMNKHAAANQKNSMIRRVLTVLKLLSIKVTEVTKLIPVWVAEVTKLIPVWVAESPLTDLTRVTAVRVRPELLQSV